MAWEALYEGVMDPCFPPETLAAYRQRPLDTPERQAVEEHAAACPDCRRVILLFGEARDPVEPTALSREGRERLNRLVRTAPRVSWALRAAAILLLAIPVVWISLRKGDAPEPVAIPVAEASLPAGMLGDLGAPRAYLRPGVDLLLEAGARVRSEGSRLQAERGRFWVEASGRPLTVEFPGGVLTLADGALVARVRPVAAAWLLREALAGEPAVEVWVIRGEVAVKVEGKSVTLSSGQKLLPGWRQVAALAQELESLEEARRSAMLAVPGRDVLTAGVPAGSWRWITVVGSRDRTAELGLAFPVEGAWYQWVAGLALIPPGPRDMIELAWDGERFSARVNGALRFSGGRERLKAVLKPASRSKWGVEAWGGSVALEKSILLEERP